jgi:hypothetical protein
LGAPSARFDGDFAFLSAVRELRDGRVLVTDAKEPAIYLIDLRSGAQQRIGGRGAGPGEYLQPGGLYAAPADSTFVLDRGQPRYLVVDPTGRVTDTRSTVVPGWGFMRTDTDRDFLRLDARGRLYKTVTAPPQARTTPGEPDSISVVRFDPATRTVDTVARLRIPTAVTIQKGNMWLSQSTYFAPADGWAVSPDGRVVAVRTVPYQIDWFALGVSRVSGAPVPVDAVRVTDADRAALMRQQRASPMSAGIVKPNGEREALTQQDLPAPVFADTKPPFEPTGVIAAPDGRVWVKRSRPAGATDVVYDVFDAVGARADRIRLPARSTIVGFGAKAIYVSELDADDVPRLRKYAL